MNDGGNFQNVLNPQEEMDGTFDKNWQSFTCPALIETDYMRIKFQLGPIKDFGINGCQIDDVIDVLVRRLEGFQKGLLKSRENALVITHLQEAQNWLYRRTRDREKRRVEGHNKV